jgi:translation initiation factor IF-2
VPTRIYALAKELKIDSKELVDLCTKAGIPGKGSALASLEDDEVAKLKAFLESGSKRAAAQPQQPLIDTKAVLSTPVSSTATLPPPPPTRPAVRRPSAPATPPAAPAPTPAAPTPPPEPVVETPAAPVAPPAPPAPQPEAKPAVEKVEKPADPAAPPTVAAEAPAASPPAPAAPPPQEPKPPLVRPTPAAPSRVPIAPQRGDAFGARRPGMIKVIDTKTKRGAVDSRKSEGDGDKPAERPRVGGLRFAQMPEVKQPPAGAKPKEPQAQKPILKLPTDVLKSGSRAPLKALADQVARRTAGGDKRGSLPPDVAADATPAGSARPARGGKKGRPGEVEPGLGDMATLRADRQKQNRNKGRRPGMEDDDGAGRIRRRTSLVRRSKTVSTAAPRKEAVSLELPTTVRAFSEAAGVSAAQVIRVLMGMGMMANINAPITEEYAELLAAELGVQLEFKQPESLEDKIAARFAIDENSEDLAPRPPIVTILGHVDHGKTSLLDKIIGTNVVAGEAGGITQHIRAYSITTKDGRHVAFVDTPGHEAFTEMRARGANVTDIAVLVVAADDGVMPQTEESISHAKAAGVPIVVAMNKIDLPGADEQKVLQQLATAGLLPSEWGGDVEVVRTSAVTGQGIDTLLETLLVTAELHEFKAIANRPASGMCLEAEQEPGRGVIAKVMVQNGTLKEGDIVVCGAAHGRVKAMYDTLRPRQKLKSAGPSTPVNLTGLDIPPNAGDKFYVLDDIAEARELAEQRAAASRKSSLAGISTKISFDEFQRRLAEGRLGAAEDVVTLNLIIRADVRGSIEAILKELGKLEHPEVRVKVLQASVGGITVADVTLAQASDAVIIGFNVIPDEAARSLADERGVEIRRYDIIYKLTDDIRAMLEGKLKPEERIVELGAALVKQVFVISRVGAVAGCQVIRGSIERNARVRVNRESRTIGDYPIDTLKREKDDVKEVARGMECGIKLQNFNDIKEGDILEAYKIEEVARTF